MNYISLAVLSVSRALLRQKKTISLINIIVVLGLLSVWALIIWYIKSGYQGVLTLQLTILVQAAAVSSVVLFTESPTNWRHYFSKPSVAWLTSMNAILFGTIVSLVTLLPYYFAYTQTNSSTNLILKALSVILVSLAWSIFLAGCSLFVKKISAAGVLRILLFSGLIIAVYYVAASEITAVLNAALEVTGLNVIVITALLSVGLFGFSIALFELISNTPERFRYNYRYSAIFTAFRVFGISSDQHSVQLTNSLLRWLRSASIQYRLAALVVCLYAINWLYQTRALIDLDGAVIASGVLVATLVASVSFTAVSQSQLHRYFWLPISSTSTAVTNWFSGVFVYLVTFAVIYWLPNSLPITALGMIGVLALVIHTATVAIAYHLSRSHQHFADRLIPLLVGSAILGLIPGLFSQSVPVDVTYAVLAIWLLATVIIFRLVNRYDYSATR